MRPYIKEWFEFLAQGKFMGLKCKSCGAVECQPYAICNTCGGHDMEWAEMSGNAKLVAFSHSLMGNYPYTDDDIMCAWYELEEGPMFSASLLDAPDDEQELMDRLPLPVKAEIVQIDEENGLYFPAFRIVGQEQE